MANEYSVVDLLDFLTHAGERGLMPAATAQALAVATRNVFDVLGAEERDGIDIRTIDTEAVIKRFNNKRAKEFNPSSLKEYGRRVRRAIELFLQWKENPAEFTVKTRTTDVTKKKSRSADTDSRTTRAQATELDRPQPRSPGGYDSAFPVRPGHIVSISNIPADLSATEADRLAQFIKMLAAAE